MQNSVIQPYSTKLTCKALADRDIWKVRTPVHLCINTYLGPFLLGIGSTMGTREYLCSFGWYNILSWHFALTSCRVALSFRPARRCALWPRQCAIKLAPLFVPRER